MSENNCQQAIIDNNRQMQEILKSSVEQGMQTSAMGQLQEFGENIQQQNQNIINGTNNVGPHHDETASNNWKNIYHPTTRQDPIIEGMENIRLGKFSRDALEARNNALISSPTFSTDCNVNTEAVFTEFKNDAQADYDRLYNYMNSLVISYNHLTEYYLTIKPIYNQKKNNLTNIKNKIDTYKQNLFIDERKNSYQSDNYDFYKSAHFFVLIIYFSLLALYLIFSDFIKEKRYKERKNIIGLISYIITPFILEYILDNIYKIYIFILEFNNIRDDIISYPYIVDKFNKLDNEI